MAITTIVPSKATPYKAIDYITDKNKAVFKSCLNLDPNQEFARQMTATARMWGKSQKEEDRKYYHLKISFAPEDWVKNGGTLTERDALRFGMDMLREFFPSHESVGAVHSDREHLHFHAVINAVDLASGKMLDMRNTDYRRLKDRVQEVCTEKGLNAIDWRKATKEKRQREAQPSEPVVSTFAEQGLRERGRSVWKDELRNIIDAAAKESRSLEQFKAALKAEGVTLTRCTDQTISYKLGDHRACRGDTLGADYTVAAIRDAIENNRADRTATLEMKIRNKRNLTAYEQNMMRDLGRLGGFTRSEVDEICSREYTWQELANVKAKYREYRRAIFAETAKKRAREEYLWQLRNERIQAELERRNALDDESFIGVLIFCIVDIFKEPPPSKFDEFIENVKMFVEMLSDAIAVMAGYEIYEDLDETGWAEICDREENLFEALEELDRVIFAKMESERAQRSASERSEPERGGER